jgi:peptidyl-prolyl cis-trans isomerase A (cyclophilin A)
MKRMLVAVALICVASLAAAADAPKPATPAKAPVKGTAVAKKEVAGAPSARTKLMNPATLNEKAPDSFDARFETTKGDFVIRVTRAWAPNGADRFYNLVRNGYYDGVRFFRVIPGFMVQFGIHGDPALNQVWREARIPDDPLKQSNKRGYVTYAMAGPNTRTSQVFINYVDRNTFLDGQGFPPFGLVTEGMDVVDKLNSEYGEGAPSGRGPNQTRIQLEGNAYLAKDFPNLDAVKRATVVAPEGKK